MRSTLRSKIGLVYETIIKNCVMIELVRESETTPPMTTVTWPSELLARQGQVLGKKIPDKLVLQMV